MFSVFGMCFNWKVLAGLGLALVAILVAAPGLALSLLPFVLLAACPLSMMLMMRGGHGHAGHQAQEHPMPQSKESLELRLQALAEEQRRLQDEIGKLEDQRRADPGDAVSERATRVA